MSRFRYRTAALIGPWRASHAEAVQDALQAGQATPLQSDPSENVLFAWTWVEEQPSNDDDKRPSVA